MIKNYLKIAIRNLLKYRLISGINLLGLTVGFTCCILILLYVKNELSYDRFNTHADRIYRVTRGFSTQDGVENLHLGCIAPPFGPRLKNDFPDIEKMTRVYSNGPTSTRYEEKIFNEINAYYADDSFFDFFTVPVLKGSAEKALAEPRSVMLSETTVKKYFGDSDPMNKVLKVDNQHVFKVTGVFKDFPAASHFHPELLLSFNSLKDSAIYGEKQLANNFGNNAFFTYILLPENYLAKKMEGQFPAFINKNMNRPMNQSNLKASDFTKLYLQKLSDIHLRSNLDGELETNGDIKRVYIFSCIALFILLIACINYMNLSTARSALRAKEIGIRKSIGAQKKELVMQFLSESVLITTITMLLAILIAILILPAVNKLSGQALSAMSLLNIRLVPVFILLPFIIGIISGIYPALFMSSFNPVKVLKGFFKTESSRFSFRKVLVVTQFSVSIILIVATLVVYRQLNFMQDSELGFNKAAIITTNYYPALDAHYESFRNKLLATPFIKEAGRSSRIPTGRLLDDLGAASVLSGDSMKQIRNASIKFVYVDHHFISTYGIQMAAGRNFSESFSTDQNNFILNEEAIKVLGWKNSGDAVGKDLAYGGVKGKIIGVVKNFHFESMHEPIVPLLMNMPASNSFYSLSIKTGKNTRAAVKAIESLWQQYLPDIPFQYSFMDDNVAQLYQSEQDQSRLFSVFSCIAIFIACLGLFGLSAFTISQRVKEIGVRKVLGASVPAIVKLLSTDFLKLVFVATLIGIPVALAAMSSWLQDFAYRIAIPWWAFAVAAMGVLFIAFITISFQVIKAASANPAKNLRTD